MGRPYSRVYFHIAFGSSPSAYRPPARRCSGWRLRSLTSPSARRLRRIARPLDAAPAGASAASHRLRLVAFGVSPARSTLLRLAPPQPQAAPGVLFLRNWKAWRTVGSRVFIERSEVHIA